MAQSKPCDRCKQNVTLRYRIQYDPSKQWFLVCRQCWNEVSMDNPHYCYGGTWKGKKRWKRLIVKTGLTRINKKVPYCCICKQREFKNSVISMISLEIPPASSNSELGQNNRVLLIEDEDLIRDSAQNLEVSVLAGTQVGTSVSSK